MLTLSRFGLADLFVFNNSQCLLVNFFNAYKSLKNISKANFLILLFSFCIFISGFYSTAAYSQSNNATSITPVLSLLLDDTLECPEITDETTLDGDQTISTQEDVDALAGVTRINASLDFTDISSDRLNLSPLNSLIQIRGSLNLIDSSLESFDGFNCLNSISQNLDIRNNPVLESVSGFKLLDTINSRLLVEDNAVLQELPSFENLTRVSSSFTIEDNPQLLNISGFDNIEQVRSSFFIQRNESLNIIDAFPALTSVNGLFNINFNSSLTEIRGFDSLESVSTRMFINSNPLLTSLSEFPSLTTVQSLTVSGNQALADISGFNQLQTVEVDFFDRGLRISSNSLLTQITGFQLLENSNIEGDIEISNNQLFDCSDSPPNFLPATISVDNAVDCPL